MLENWRPSSLVQSSGRTRNTEGCSGLARRLFLLYLMLCERKMKRRCAPHQTEHKRFVHLEFHSVTKRDADQDGAAYRERQPQSRFQLPGSCEVSRAHSQKGCRLHFCLRHGPGPCGQTASTVFPARRINDSSHVGLCCGGPCDWPLRRPPSFLFGFAMIP